MIEIEDCRDQKSSVTIHIITKKDGIEYNKDMVELSVEKLLGVLNEHVSAGFVETLRIALNKDKRIRDFNFGVKA